MGDTKLEANKDDSLAENASLDVLPKKRRKRLSGVIAALAGATALSLVPMLASSAEDQNNISDNLDRKEILRILREQQKELADQRQMLRDQEQKIASLTSHPRERTSRRGRRAAVSNPNAAPNPLLETRAVPSAGPATAPANPLPGVVNPAPYAIAENNAPAESSPNSAEAPSHPVGRAPEQPEQAPEVPQISNTAGVLTPKGTLVVEPYFQYLRSSLNSFSFQGVQIINAFLIGQIQAGRSVDDLVSSGATLRYGITNRLSGEVKLPFVYRSNHVETGLINTSGLVSAPQNTSGGGLSDIEAAVNYQINDGQDDWPYFIANLRYKSASGTGPFDVAYNADGSAKRLPTGSGFNAIEPSVSVIYPSDPAVLFGSLGYIKNFGGAVNKTIAGSRFGDVTPGDTYEAVFGVGLALNEKLSLNLGYQHDYIQGTREIINNAPQNTSALQVGQAHLGLALKTSDTSAVNVDLATGVTRDAPDVQLTVRVPLSIDVFRGGASSSDDSGSWSAPSSSKSDDEDDDDDKE